MLQYKFCQPKSFELGVVSQFGMGMDTRVPGTSCNTSSTRSIMATSELADQPLDGAPVRRSAGKRRLSYSSQTSAGVRIASGAGAHPRAGVRTLSIRSQLGFVQLSARNLTFKLNYEPDRSEVDATEIHSPTPKRHFLLQTESSDLLNSRPDTPFSTISTASHIDSIPSTNPRRHSKREHTLSFSSLHDQESRKLKPEKPGLKSRVPSSTYVREANEASLGRRWIKWMHRNRLDDHVLACIIGVALLFKWCVGLGGYSGQSEYTRVALSVT